jgi:hypothetical protein
VFLVIGGFVGGLSLSRAAPSLAGCWPFLASRYLRLALPAATALLMRPGSLPDLHLLERFFMPLLVLVGWMNFAGTRRAAAVSCVAAAQLLLLRGFLPGVDMDGAMQAAATGGTDAAAAGLLLVGTLLAAVQAFTSRGRRARRGERGTPSGHTVAAIIDPSFLALRETLGAAWSLRIAERFDTVAAARGWPCRLRFVGLECGGDLGFVFLRGFACAGEVLGGGGDLASELRAGGLDIAGGFLESGGFAAHPGDADGSSDERREPEGKPDPTGGGRQGNGDIEDGEREQDGDDGRERGEERAVASGSVLLADGGFELVARGFR